MKLEDWIKKKEYLICVDSDGCAMDTMNCKHIRCFGPCMVTEWKLEEWEKPILDRWNDINLFSLSRGINRFKGLAIALSEINQTYTKIEGVEELVRWADEADELSNHSLEIAIKTAEGPCLAKALSWSLNVNRAIEELPDDIKVPFEGTAKGLAAAHMFADVAVVSSANRDAVELEWEHWNLLENVDILCCQDTGSKAACIEALKAKGYDADHIVMVGDAPGDQAAAEKNGVYYYPILVNNEKESWKEFTETAVRILQAGEFASYAQEKLEQFKNNLNA